MKNDALRHLLILGLALAGVAGCDDDAEGGDPATRADGAPGMGGLGGSADAAPADAAPTDAAPADAALADAALTDAALADAAQADAAQNDAALADAAPNDAAPNDAAPNDAAPNDAAPNDAVPNDAAPNDAAPNDAAPNDAALLDAALADAAPADLGLPALTPSETCVDAPSLRAASEVVVMPANRYTHRATGHFGATNDYNPLDTEGLPPGCSLVHDASGNDVAYQVTLQPGQTLRLRLTVEPVAAIPAVYLMEGCPVTGWPDIDGSGLCGNNEYFTEGFCPANFCGPLEWSFTWPVTLDGLATLEQTFTLVLDEIRGTAADTFVLEWVID